MRKRIWISGAVAVAIIVSAVGAYGVSKDWHLILMQKIGPTDSSLVASDRGIREAEVTRHEIGDDQVALAVPADPNGTLVVWFHGQSGTVEDIISDPQQVGTRDALLDAGYSIAATDGGLEAWGNDLSVEAYADLHDWALTVEDFEETALIGKSMGGLASLRLAPEIPAAAWVGIFPVCNLDALPDMFPGIDVSWPERPDFLTPTALTERLDGLPMLFFASPNDTWVPKATNTDACAAAAEAAGADVEVVNTFGEHGNQSAFQPHRIVEFLNQAIPSTGR